MNNENKVKPNLWLKNIMDIFPLESRGLIQVYNQDCSKKSDKKPIYRGCSNERCFCSGKCKDIIGYK